MLFTMTFMLVFSIAAPYRRDEDDYFAVTCNFSLTAVFLLCTMLKVTPRTLTSTPRIQPLTPRGQPPMHILSANHNSTVL